MSLGAFAVVAARERELGAPVTLSNLAGFGWERPYLGAAMWVFMLGFLGFPLTGGFIGKFYVFAAAYRHGWWWLIVAGVIATMTRRTTTSASCARCTSATASSCSSPRPEARRHGTSCWASRVAICLVVTVGSFFAVQPLIDIAQSAARSLPL